jgi:hypothetical protein
MGDCESSNVVQTIVALMSEKKIGRLRSDYESREIVILRIVAIATNFLALTRKNLNFRDIMPSSAEFCLLPDLCWFLA